jgi:monofunctional glycosyltransferase
MFRSRHRYRIKPRFGDRLLRLGWVLRWGLRILLILLIVDLFYLASIWPDWQRIAHGAVPVTQFIIEYKKQRLKDKHLLPLRWQPVALDRIPKPLIRTVIVAEDSRFYEHGGFDLIAFKEAMGHNLEEGRLALGASTISQQTVKNLFLNKSRNPLRKWHELILTWGMERSLSKNRILEIYLNVAEFGQGVYGVEAASQVYWGVSVVALSTSQMAELAATLPSPIKHNPITRTPSFEKRAQKIINFLRHYPGQNTTWLDRAVKKVRLPAVLPPSSNQS